MMSPQIGGMEPILVPEEPSPWWYWGPAIGIILISMFAVLGLAIAAIFPYDSFMEHYSEPQQPGPYPENGSSQEQSEWNQSDEEYEGWNQTNNIFDAIENSGMQEKQMWVGTLSVIASIPVIILLFSRHRWSFYAATIWILFKSILESFLAMEVQYMMDDIFSVFPNNTELPPTWIYSLSGIFQVICCNITLLAVVVVCSLKTADDEVVPPSGFHIPNGSETT
jgi:hypothetical protein